MGFTTIQNVSGMFPSFVRGTPNQRPTDDLVQQFIDDIASDIVSRLQQRFNEIAAQFGTFNAYLASIGVPPPVGVDPTESPWNLGNNQTMQLSVLEKGNRYGAAHQLGVVLSTYGVTGALALSKHYDEADWKPFLAEISAVDRNGRPKVSGAFDMLFDTSSKIMTPRAGLEGIAGGDQQVGVSPAQENAGVWFGKWGIDYGRSSWPLDWWNVNN